MFAKEVLLMCNVSKLKDPRSSKTANGVIRENTNNSRND